MFTQLNRSFTNLYKLDIKNLLNFSKHLHCDNRQYTTNQKHKAVNVINFVGPETGKNKVHFDKNRSKR